VRRTKQLNSSTAQQLNSSTGVLSLGIDGVDSPRSTAEAERLSGRFRERIVFFLIGGLLIAAATSKAAYLLTNPFADIHLGLPTEVIWLSVVIDFAVGATNLASCRTRLLSFVNLVVFTGFFLFNLVRFAGGETTCACSGFFEIPIWITLLLDLSVVCFFLHSRHRRQEAIHGAKDLHAIFAGTNPIVGGIAAGAGFLTVVVVAFPTLGFGSIVERLFANEAIEAKVTFQDDLQAGKQKLIEIAIRNNSDWPAKFVGVQGSCSCLSIADDLAARELPARGHTLLPIWITPPQTGKLHQRLTIFLEHPERFRIDVEVVGFVKRGD
jgi:hypothetical protein